MTCALGKYICQRSPQNKWKGVKRSEKGVKIQILKENVKIVKRTWILHFSKKKYFFYTRKKQNFVLNPRLTVICVCFFRVFFGFRILPTKKKASVLKARNAFLNETVSVIVLISKGFSAQNMGVLAPKMLYFTIFTGGLEKSHFLRDML